MKNLKILLAIVAFSAAGMIGCGGDDAAAEETTATETATEATEGGEAAPAEGGEAAPAEGEAAPAEGEGE
jgi:hypothetical protein